MASKKGPISGQVGTYGSREWVKYRSPREGEMAKNGPVPVHPYPLKRNSVSLKGGGPGIRAQGAGHETPPNAYPGRRKAPKPGA